MPFVIPVKAMALTVSTLMCGTMFTTYYFCVHDSECPALPKLPTISNTWEDPPGNFLSRVVVSIVALLMALLQPTLFLPAKGKLWCNGTVNLVLGVISCLSLRRILDSVARHRGRWTGGCVQPGHALLEQLASDGVAVHGVPSGRHATGCEG